MKDRREFAHEIKADVFAAIREKLGDDEAAVLASHLAGDVYTLALTVEFPGMKAEKTQ